MIATLALASDSRVMLDEIVNGSVSLVWDSETLLLVVINNHLGMILSKDTKAEGTSKR